jgi:uncharacterized protein (TIGR02145 family)
MKKEIVSLMTILFIVSISAQIPQKMSYQSVVRNSSNQLVTNKVVGMKISILKGSTTGSSVYSEIQTPSTNANGLISIEIGSGTGFNTIDWSTGLYFIKTETDPAGGTNYTISGVSQLLSVPYSLYANKAGNGFSGNYSDLTNKPNLSDTAKYLKTEKEPAFNASLAKGIKTTDTAKWNAKSSFSGNYVDLTNKPNLSDTAKYLKTEKEPAFNASIAKGIKSTDTSKWNTKSNFSGKYADLSDKPILYDSSWAAIKDKPIFADVAISGNYNDLMNQPSIPDTLKKLKLDAGNNIIKNVANPIGNGDAVNKAYVTLRVSSTGDTLFLGNNQYVIITGISVANPPVKDKDGNVYKTVIIGNQTWMVQNLSTTKYNDGTSIPKVKGWTAWSKMTTPAYSWQKDDSATYKNPYGALYNWYAVNTGKLCPTGWHVPSNAEWTTLTTFLGGDDVAGSKLKENGTTHWKIDFGADNSSGFTALPGEYYGANSVGGSGYWWSSTISDSKNALMFYLYVDNGVQRGDISLDYSGFSVRCLKN